MLTRRFPALRQLSTQAYPTLLGMALALEGHTVMRDLNISMRDEDPPNKPKQPLFEWPRNLLSTMPQPQRLHLYENYWPVLNRLVVIDLADCSRLTSLMLKWEYRARFTAASAAVLAAGACNSRLQRLELHSSSSGVELPAVAAVVGAGMPALQEVRATLLLPAELQGRAVGEMSAAELEAAARQALGSCMERARSFSLGEVETWQKMPVEDHYCEVVLDEGAWWVECMMVLQ